ncbi:MAG: DnaD domain protein [Clostridia bacterium]|nr:DnaD domain protein [Clostridia bacterium]
MKLNFQQDALVLPGAVLSHASEADAAAMRVLLWLASDLALADKPKQLAKLADCDQKTLKASLQYWQDAGVLAAEGESVPAMATLEAPAAKKPSKRVLLQRADELPNYTSTELADLMESRASVRATVDEAQRIIGKMFNPSEVNILVGMLDYLSLSEECILLLLAYCKDIGKTNLRAIEKYAYTLVDKGITDAEAMEEEFRVARLMHEFEGQVRALFGMQKRALTSRESKMLSAWASFGYGIDVVREAYELTVTATNEPSVAYANAIMERWNAEGLKTLEQIRAAQEASKKDAARADKTALGNSFDTDDFFEAALQRSFSTRRED